MTTAKETDLLTQVGPATPMGAMMRRYWVPALLSEEIPDPGSGPRRVRVLAEDLVAFRDPTGRVGLLNEHCPHRGASLVLARNEECGLRCIYHGWKIDQSGKVLETPNEPERSKLRNTFVHTAYPVHEAGGIIWAFMGEGEPPPFPAFEWHDVPASNVSLVHVRMNCNWLQAIEGVLDSAHTNALHSNVVGIDTGDIRLGAKSHRTDGKLSRPSDDPRPRLRVLDTPYGFRYGAIRKTIKDPDKFKYVRTTVYLAPFHVMLASSAGIGDVQSYVPIDDEHTSFYYAHYSVDQPVDDEEWREWIGCRRGIDLDEFDRPVRNASNQWLQDRETMARNESYSGISGVLNEDFAVQESMGPRFDRSREHLGATDLAVLHLRRQLLESIRRCNAGNPPVGLEGELIAYEKIRPADGVIPIDTPWEVVGADTDGSVLT